MQNVVSSVSEDIYSTLDPEYEKERTKKLKAKARAAATTGKDTVEPAGLELPKGLTEGFNQGIAQLEKVSTEALAVAETALAAAENYTAQALNAAETVGTEAINAVESLGTTAFSFLNDTFQFTKANKEDEIVGEVGSNGGVPVQEGGKQEKISQSDVEVAPVRTDEQHVDDSK